MKIGETLSHYRIVAFLGAGGMGEVFKAEDTRLKRPVALKFLPLSLVGNDEARQRLLLEAQAVSALDHPNICTIHEIEESADGRIFLAMAYYEGETLRQRIDREPVPVDEALEIMTQVTRGVAAAHEAGVIHRDIKSANIFIRASGSHDPSRVKLLDFGIAKLAGQTGVTRTGTTVGTAAYMAPEHIAGHAIDARADVWSLGVVFYELLARRLPFDGQNDLAMLRAIADGVPRPLRQDRPDVAPPIERVIDRTLQKDPKARYESARALLQDIEAVRDSMRAPSTAVQTPPPAARVPALARRSTRLAIAAVAVALIGVTAWTVITRNRARDTTRHIDEIRALVAREEFASAFRRLHTAPAHVAADAAFLAFTEEAFLPLRVNTDPPEADVYIKGYDEPDAEWIFLGRSPVETRSTYGPYQWRIVKAGFEPFEGTGVAPNAIGTLNFSLRTAGSTPPGMIYVPGGNAANVGRLAPFFIDRFELTNKEYKRFVDAGGYRTRQYWTMPIVRGGREVSWEDAVAEFRDATGRPGPSTWELGTYPEGQDDWPVRGVSWHEAMAYASFAGKSLPTFHHWRMAAALGLHSQILELSNFSGKAPARVGAYKGLGAWGTFDMAGNVKEWCVNATGDRRYILGGAWNEPNYQYRQADARDPSDRSENNGFRLMSALSPADLSGPVAQPILQTTRDYSTQKPVADDVFAALARLYAFDAGDLDVRTDSVDDTAPDWRVERVSYDAAYDGERIVAYLFLPKNRTPPFQTVIYFPHSGGFVLDSFHKAEMQYLGFMVKAGRALLFPMYKGMYERRVKTPLSGPNATRDQQIQQVKDFRRSVEFALTRSDLAHDRLAFFGVSAGAVLAPQLLALEPRMKAAILWSGGFPTFNRPPEIDPVHFAPRVRTPVLMLNGRDDFTFPIETSQEPMFRLLGTPPEHKRRELYPGGHIFPFSRMMKDSLDWLDQYLGPP